MVTRPKTRASACLACDILVKQEPCDQCDSGFYPETCPHCEGVLAVVKDVHAFVTEGRSK